MKVVMHKFYLAIPVLILMGLWGVCLLERPGATGLSPRVMTPFILASILSYLVQMRWRSFLPSSMLFIFFAITPIFGIVSYLNYWRIYSDYLGLDSLNVTGALVPWFDGTLAVMTGVAMMHGLRRLMGAQVSRRRWYYSWNWSRLDYWLILMCVTGLAFTAICIARIGYIPILKGDIDFERFHYRERVGEWVMKLARIWLAVYCLSAARLAWNSKTCVRKWSLPNLALIGLMCTAFVVDSIYGDRIHQFLMIAFLVILFGKMAGRPRWGLMVMVTATLLVFCILVPIARSGTFRYKDEPVKSKAVRNFFGEYVSFTYAVETFKTDKLLHGKTFLGTIAPIMPKQVWAAFGVDKQKMFEQNSAAAMAEIYGAYAGIRIGILGEGFINFGYTGIIMVGLIAGLIFGFFEIVFLGLEPFQISEPCVAFILSVLLYLPLAQTNALASILPLNILFIWVIPWFCARKRILPCQELL